MSCNGLRFDAQAEVDRPKKKRQINFGVFFRFWRDLGSTKYANQSNELSFYLWKSFWRFPNFKPEIRAPNTVIRRSSTVEKSQICEFSSLDLSWIAVNRYDYLVKNIYIYLHFVPGLCTSISHLSKSFSFDFIVWTRQYFALGCIFLHSCCIVAGIVIRFVWAYEMMRLRNQSTINLSAFAVSIRFVLFRFLKRFIVDNDLAKSLVTFVAENFGFSDVRTIALY